MQSHPRDKNLLFNEEKHVYTTIDGKELPSVTTYLHRFFPEFPKEKIAEIVRHKPGKYNGMEVEDIISKWDREGKEARDLGTLMHAQIENYLLRKELPEIQSKEFNQFLEFWSKFTKNNPFVSVYRLEWRVYTDNIAGSIDCVCITTKGNIIIIDWKRSKEIKKTNRFSKCLKPLNHLDDCNYNHYSLQLNAYRYILEKEYNAKVKGMYIVSFHPNQETYKAFPVPRMDEEINKIL